MLLAAEEGVLRNEYAVLVDGEGAVGGGRTAGVLYLTNQRIVFETSESQGLVRDLVRGRPAVTALDAPLTSLRNVSVRRPRLGRARLLVEIPHGRASFDVLDPEAWYRAVAEARRAFPSAHAPVPVVHTIERQVVKVRCRHCGSLGNEVDGRCTACGAPL